MIASLTALAARLPADLLRVAPSPSPTDVLRPGLDPYDVSPGLLGFLAIFAVAGVCIVGWLSLNRKVRRLRFEERAAGAAGADDGPVADGTLPGGGALPDDAALLDDAAQPGGTGEPGGTRGTGDHGVSTDTHNAGTDPTS
ncbi:hypothetical protein ACTVCO_06000 [Sanguibacter sp. A247]|uniref:hypothetical protein n=1 Tax=unclassified Sanguibacter TaxID=2645534 RepID=UPI003FD71E15